MRYAIYYAPRETDELHDVASRWLGRDVLRGANREQPSPAGIVLGELTREPRRYGFHATLKPPFALAAGSTAPALLAAVESLADDMEPVGISGLAISRIGGFFALTAQGDQRPLNQVAARCLIALDSFRAPPPLAELMRRRQLNLNERQERLLHRWGYPFVLEEYRFHLTLTGVCDDAAAPALEAALVRHFAPVLDRPLTVDALSIFVEPAAGEPFVFLSRARLGGGLQPTVERARAAS